MFWRLGTMVERFFEAKSFGLQTHILMFRRSCTVMHTVFMLSMYHDYVSWLCILAMYHGYVSWLCIMAMYRGYVSWLCTTPTYHGYVSWLCIMAMYIILHILRIIRNDSSESKKVNFWKMVKILFWYRIQNLRKILWRFAPKSLIFVHSASSYGQNKFRIEFRSQCHIFGWYIDISLGESGAHEAPYVSLLIRVSRARLGESPGASNIAAPLDIR